MTKPSKNARLEAELRDVLESRELAFQGLCGAAFDRGLMEAEFERLRGALLEVAPRSGDAGVCWCAVPMAPQAPLAHHEACRCTRCRLAAIHGDHLRRTRAHLYGETIARYVET